MSWFEFEVEDADGHLVKGKIEADTVGSAVAKLEAAGHSVLSLNRISAGEPAKAALARESGGGWKSRITACLENREHWLPGLQAFEKELPRGPVRKEVNTLVAELDRENVEAEDLLQSPRLIALLPLLSEDKGALTSERLHDWVSRRQAFGSEKLRLWKSLSYPLALLSGTFLLLAILSLFLIPFFKELYLEFGIRLPASTRWLIWLSDAFSENLVPTVIVLLLLGISSIALVIWWRSCALTNRTLGTLVAGTSSNLRYMSGLIETVAELLRFGAPIDESLQIAAAHSSHRMYATACRNLASALANDETLSSKDPSISCLPPLMLTAIQSNDTGTPSVPTLQTVATIYAERVNSRVGWLHSLVPPAAILVAGVCIAFVILSLLLPLFTLVSSLA